MFFTALSHFPTFFFLSRSSSLSAFHLLLFLSLWNDKNAVYKSVGRILGVHESELGFESERRRWPNGYGCFFWARSDAGYGVSFLCYGAYAAAWPCYILWTQPVMTSLRGSVKWSHYLVISRAVTFRIGAAQEHSWRRWAASNGSPLVSWQAVPRHQITGRRSIIWHPTSKGCSWQRRLHWRSFIRSLSDSHGTFVTSASARPLCICLRKEILII